MISREPSPEDDRGVVVTITDAGRAPLDRLLPGHLEVVNGLLHALLSRRELETLAALLAPVREHMRQAPPRSTRRVVDGEVECGRGTHRV